MLLEKVPISGLIFEEGLRKWVNFFYGLIPQIGQEPENLDVIAPFFGLEKRLCGDVTVFEIFVSFDVGTSQKPLEDLQEELKDYLDFLEAVLYLGTPINLGDGFSVAASFTFYSFINIIITFPKG